MRAGRRQPTCVIWMKIIRRERNAMFLLRLQQQTLHRVRQRIRFLPTRNCRLISAHHFGELGLRPKPSTHQMLNDVSGHCRDRMRISH